MVCVTILDCTGRRPPRRANYRRFSRYSPHTRRIAMTAQGSQLPVRTGSCSAVGLHRVLEPAGVLPQAARRLDAGPALWPDEARVAVEQLNLDAASYRQLAGTHTRPDG